MRLIARHILHNSLCLLALCWLSGLQGFGQSQQVTSTLDVKDPLIEVGNPFKVSMTILHPEDVVVIFPDSANEFAPFELYKSEPFTTYTENGISRDVAVFQLYTWDVDTAQTIALPYLVVKDGDTTAQTSASAHLSVRELIPTVTDSTQLKLIENVQPIAEPFNWRAFAFFFSFFLLLVVLGIVLLRKPIRRWLRRRKVERDWQPVLRQLRQIEQLQDNQAEFILQLNRIWKNYIDRDRSAAFTSLTTSELRSAIERFEMLRPADRELLSRSSQMADFILFIDIRLTSDELRRLYTEVYGIMEREYQRRKGAAEA